MVSTIIIEDEIAQFYDGEDILIVDLQQVVAFSAKKINENEADVFLSSPGVTATCKVTPGDVPALLEHIKLGMR